MASELATWLSRLESYSPHEIDLGLDRVRDVFAVLGVHAPATVLHVAGTNGKGSSVALAAALLAATGQTIGTYTSPHVLRFNERIVVDGAPVGDDELVAAFERVDAARGQAALTYFEFATLAALVIFDRRGVTAAVMEIGMGGRLDAVNAIEPTAGLITNVSLDHREWLGDDVETIAGEKAGIMRAGKPVVFASADVPARIGQCAEAVGADLIVAGRDYHWQVSDAHWEWRGRAHRLPGLQRPGLVGDIQVENAAGVLALLEAAGFESLLDTATVNRAFAEASLPGRMQTIEADRHYLLDVAHNPGAAAVLAAALADDGFPGRTVAIVGVMGDKDVAGIVTPLDAIVDDWIAVRADGNRALPADELARRIANATNRGCLEAGSVEDALAAARRMTGPDDRVLVTGSFYIVGPVLGAIVQDAA